jgi:hypothetical protein
MIRPGRPKLERKVALEAPPPPPTRSRAAIPVRKQTRKRFRENRLNLNFHVVPPVDLNYLYVPGKYVTGKKQVTVGVVVRLFVCLFIRWRDALRQGWTISRTIKRSLHKNQQIYFIAS